MQDEANLRRILDVEGLDRDAIERLMREFNRVYQAGIIKHYRLGAQDSFSDLPDEMMV